MIEYDEIPELSLTKKESNEINEELHGFVRDLAACYYNDTEEWEDWRWDEWYDIIRSEL